MRLGISTYTFAWEASTGKLSVQALVDRALDMGVRVLQIGDNFPPDTYTDASMQAIATYARWMGVNVEIGTRGCRPEHLRRFIAHAVTLGSPILGVALDDRDDRPDEDEVVQRLSQVRRELEQANVLLAIENHDRFRSAALERIVNSIESTHVGICIDTANGFGAGEGPETVISRLGLYCANVHIKDFVIQRTVSGQGFTIEGCPAGTGLLDIPWALNKFAEFGCACSAIAELWVPPEPTLEQTIRKEATWARESVANLKKWIPD